MRKTIWYAAAMSMAVMLPSCEKDDPVVPAPDPDAPTATVGAYILNQGSLYNKIDGGLYVIDFNSQSVIPNAYLKANGSSIGDTPQCGVSYGSKIYVGLYDSNTIEVIDRNTFRSVNRISLADSENGRQPRSMVAHDGKVYVSMYNGFVARLDTVSLKIDASVKVGPNPDVIAIYQDKIYVPNTDGMNYPAYGTTVSVIDIASFSTASTIQAPLNPEQFFVNETGLYLLAKGNYDDVISKAYRFDGTGFEEIAEATIMAVGERKVYLINAPFYGDGTIQYKIYDPDNKTLSDWDIQKVDYPSNIAVDRIGGHILISSYVMDGQYPSYVAPGYVNQYTIDGAFEKRYSIGTGPTCIFFNQK